jgi:hypothetical protein
MKKFGINPLWSFKKVHYTIEYKTRSCTRVYALVLLFSGVALFRLMNGNS